MPEIVPIRLVPGEGALDVLDQTLLPFDRCYIRLATIHDVCEAIASLRVRGAPLLGLIGAAGLAVAVHEVGPATGAVTAAADRIASTRPTAVDLRARTEQALDHALGIDESQRQQALWAFAARLLDERIAEDRRIGELGAGLFQPGWSVLTHCNTGALATGGIGTALGVIRTAWEQNKFERCYATETRPLLQGARLTAWELRELGIPATLLPDTAAASLIASGKVQAVITGADRIARNGDTANKIGTYGLAALAARHGLPFFIAAPTSTIDPACPSGASIPIEFRASEEVGGFGPQRWSPPGIDAYNPAFDVTPGELIHAVITERGVATPPYPASIAALVRERIEGRTAYTSAIPSLRERP